MPGMKTAKPAKLRTRTRLVRMDVRSDLLRTEKLDGRDYLVAPVVPFVEGVHNKEFVAFEEMAVFPEAWDGIPLPIDHPSDSDGNAVTANSPDVIERSVVGRLFNVVAREDIRGIAGEIWVDIEKAGSFDGGKEVLRKLNASEQLEVSTAYYTFTDTIPGEWFNPKTKRAEKFEGTQTGIRPDHLALLPFDIGACNWADGCGAPRNNTAAGTTNGDVTLNSEVSITSPGESMPREKELKVNGKQLGKVLEGVLAAHAAEDGSTDGIKNRLAAAIGVDIGKINALVSGEMDFAPRKWLEIMAVVLDCDAWDIFSAASNDNSDARWSAQVQENVNKKTEDPVTILDNHLESETETAQTGGKPCGSCEKSLKVKVQEIVTNTLRSIGVTWNEKEKSMDKTQRVEALIASNKTQFSENHREWLLSLNEEQLAVLEPTVETAEAVETKEKATPVAANTEKTVEPKAPEITAEMVYKALGMNAEDFASVKAAKETAKVARNTKITEIAAIEGCPYSKEELAIFSDVALEKTLRMLQPDGEPFRAAASGSPTQNERDTVPVPPAILLAKPEAKEGK